MANIILPDYAAITNPDPRGTFPSHFSYPSKFPPFKSFSFNTKYYLNKYIPSHHSYPSKSFSLNTKYYLNKYIPYLLAPIAL